VRVMVGELLRHQGHSDEAETCLLRGLALNEESGQDGMRAATLVNLARIAGDRGDLATRRTRLIEAVRVARHHPRAQAFAWNDLGHHEEQRGRLKAALRAVRCGQRAAAADASVRLEAYANVRLSELCWQLGRLRSARNAVKAAAASFRETDQNDILADCCVMQGHVHVASGRPDRAIACYERALAVEPHPGSSWPAPVAIFYATILLERGELIAAREQLAAPFVARSQRHRAEVSGVRAELEARSGDVLACQLRIAEAMELAAILSSSLDRAWAFLRCARAARLIGDLDRAAQLVADTGRICDDLGLRSKAPLRRHLEAVSSLAPRLG
jgi:hypothetical protein